MLKFLPLILIFTLFISSPNSKSDFEYIGASKCKMCHNKPPKGAQYKKWSEGRPHANAMKSLKGDEINDTKCLKCHSTASSIVNDGVSCESCHGPGSVYKSMSIMKNKTKALENGLLEPVEQVCKKCHNEESPNFKGFDFKEYSAKIAHPDPSK